MLTLGLKPSLAPLVCKAVSACALHSGASAAAKGLQAPPALALQVKTTTSQHLGDNFDTLFAGLAPAKGSPISGEEMRRCFFGDYMNTAAEPDERQYAEVSDAQALISTMEGYLVDHNGGTLHCSTRDMACCSAHLVLSDLTSSFMVVMLARY